MACSEGTSISEIPFVMAQFMLSPLPFSVATSCRVVVVPDSWTTMQVILSFDLLLLPNFIKVISGGDDKDPTVADAPAAW